MNEVTRILLALEQGQPHAADELLPLVYEELRRLAAAKMRQESPGQTLQTTALVHEAYLRLVGGEQPAAWNGRAHFFAAAAEAMRRILINRARDKQRLKRSGGRRRLDFDQVAVADRVADEELLALDEALEKLNAKDPACAELVKLRFFAGLTMDQAAEILGMAPRTADRCWAFARAWLFRELGGQDPGVNQ
jgi:RNA polymerase sigma factor (TIGR02999 family)